MSIEAKNLKYNFGQKQALDDVSFMVEAGKFTALLGPNGAGKSTFFHILCGLLIAKKGEIIIDGLNMNTNPLKIRQKLGLVFQENTLDLELSVAQNLRYFAALQGIDKSEIDKRISEVMERLNITERKNDRARDLNGGHRRRLEIARALLHKPSIIALDEPTAGLDRASKITITEHAHELAKDGMTVFWVTHLLDEIRPKDHVILLKSGKVTLNGELDKIGGMKALEKHMDLNT